MPKNENNISMSVIKRMPRYYRFLGNLKKNGVERISSRELSQRMGFTASQIRQDLNCFGGFGQQGYGYNVEQLYSEIGTILGVDNSYKTIIIGVGHLGRAIASHMKFEKSGFEIIGLFDCNKSITGEEISGITVKDSAELKSFCEQYCPEVAVLCIPEASAKELVPTLVDCGIKNFWNFSHYDISAEYNDVVSENVHLKDSLMTLNYQIMNRSDND